MPRAMSPADLIARRSGPATYAFIDVREKGEFNLAQIEGASPLPRGDFEGRIAELVPNRSVPIVLCCSDGWRSALAAATAERLGYQDVSYLAGGLDAWRAAGQTTIEGWGVPGKDYGEKVAVVEDIPQITPEELAERQQRGERFVILDSRTIPEYEASHLPGAYAVPGGQLPIEVLDLIGDGEPTVIVNCAGRTRSILGAHLLRRMGLSQVMAFKNGTMAWHMAGFPLEHGPDPRPGRAPSPEAKAAANAFADRLAAEESLAATTPAELRRLQESGDLHYLVDVRLPAEYEAGHIPGAVSCQAGQLALMSEQIVGVREAPIVMTCDDRARAIYGAALYRQMGFPRVSFLAGGTRAWQAAGYPLATGPAERRVPGLAEARAQASTLSPADLNGQLQGPRPPVILDVRGSGDCDGPPAGRALALPRLSGASDRRLCPRQDDAHHPDRRRRHAGLPLGGHTPGSRVPEHDGFRRRDRRLARGRLTDRGRPSRYRGHARRGQRRRRSVLPPRHPRPLARGHDPLLRVGRGAREEVRDGAALNGRAQPHPPTPSPSMEWGNQ